MKYDFLVDFSLSLSLHCFFSHLSLLPLNSLVIPQYTSCNVCPSLSLSLSLTHSLEHFSWWYNSYQLTHWAAQSLLSFVGNDDEEDFHVDNGSVHCTDQNKLRVSFQVTLVVLDFTCHWSTMCACVCVCMRESRARTFFGTIQSMAQNWSPFHKWTTLDRVNVFVSYGGTFWRDERQWQSL